MTTEQQIKEIESIIEANYYDVYDGIKFIQEFYKSKPKQPVKPKLPANYKLVDLENHLQLFTSYTADYANYKKEVAAVYEHNNKIDALVETYIRQESGLTDLNIPQKQKDKVYAYAWSNGHSSGYSEVYNELIDIVDLFDYE